MYPLKPVQCLSRAALRFSQFCIVLICTIFWNSSDLQASDVCRLKLNSGLILEGRVFDLGAEFLVLESGSGHRQILKRDVKFWSVRMKRAKATKVLDTLLLHNGREVSSPDISFDSLKSEWVVQGEFGVTKFQADRVIRLLRKDGTTSDGLYGIRYGYEALVAKAIAEIKSTDIKVSQAAADYLKSAGFFAYELLKKEKNPDFRLLDLINSQALRIALPQSYALKMPDLLEKLELKATDSNSAVTDKKFMLQQALLEFGPEAFPLMSAILISDSQDPEIRAYCVQSLQRMNRIRDLVLAFEQTGGKARLAAAVALGDAGIYVGLEVLITALSFDSPEIQELAITKLEEFTGQRFGFVVGTPISERTGSISQWRGWWTANRERIEALLVEKLKSENKSLNGEAVAVRQRGIQFYRRANKALEDGDVQLAIRNHKNALTEDPTYLQPLIALGIIYYQEESMLEEGKEWFKRAINRAPAKGEEGLMRLVYFHLGRIHRFELNPKVARSSFLRAIELDPQFADAWFELGSVIFDQAVGDPNFSAKDRKASILEAAVTYEEGYKKLHKYRTELVVLTSDRLPTAEEMPYSARSYNRNLKHFKDRLRDMEASFAYKIAQCRYALGLQEAGGQELQTALKWATQAVSSERPKARYCDLLAHILDSSNQPRQAKEMRMKAKELKKAEQLKKLGKEKKTSSS